MTPFELPACNISDRSFSNNDISAEEKAYATFKNSLETIDSALDVHRTSINVSEMLQYMRASNLTASRVNPQEMTVSD